MKSFGQFCSVARALELLGERWTLLVVRELLLGGRTFGDVRRGVPRISRTMLAARLRDLVDAGVVVRMDGAYALSPSGRELAEVVRALGVWGQRWLPRTVTDDELDLDALVWDMRRRVDAKQLPRTPVVVRIEATDLRKSRPHWLLMRDGEVSLCTSNPGFAESLTVRGDRRLLVGWWRGDLSFDDARRRGLTVDGERSLARAFPRWFERYLFAEVEPAKKKKKVTARPSGRP